MDIFNLTHNRLIENGFKVDTAIEMENMGSVFYRSKIHNVILRKIHNTEEIKSIKSFSLNVRGIMMDYEENIWNTYLLFCIPNEVDAETNYEIERNTIAIRKYVICNEADLNRVPFLDEFKEVKKINKSDKELEETNEYIKVIIDFLKVNLGHQNKLDKNQIDEVTKKITDMVGNGYEN